MTFLPALALATALDQARVLALQTDRLDSRLAFRVLTEGPPSGVSVRREGLEVVLRLGAQAPSDLSLPPPALPIEAIRLVEEPEGLSVYLKLPPGVPFEVRRQGTTVSVVFGAIDVGQEGLRAQRDVRELYTLLFPIGVEEEGPPGGVALPGAELEEADEAEGGLFLGFMRLHPGLVVSYVSADSSLTETPESVRDSYFEFQPRLTAELVPSLNPYLTLRYEPRFRRASSFPLVETTSHMFLASAELPMGAATLLRASHGFATGILETEEVDPGREYFFDLGEYTRKQYQLGARYSGGGRFDLDLAAGLNRVRVEGGGFFDYEQRTVSVTLGYELSPRLRSGLRYGYAETPTPEERPEAESTSHAAHLVLEGDLLPRVQGELALGFLSRTNPNVAEEGRRYRGLSLQGSLRRDLAPASWLRLRLNRTTYPSAYEANGFYVTSAGLVELTVPLPFYVSLRGGVGYHRNSYRVATAGLGAPRQDRILTWSLGLGRSVTRRAFLRADFVSDRRDSNLDVFDRTSNSFVIQLGVSTSEGGGGR